MFGFTQGCNAVTRRGVVVTKMSVTTLELMGVGGEREWGLTSGLKMGVVTVKRGFWVRTPENKSL